MSMLGPNCSGWSNNTYYESPTVRYASSGRKMLRRITLTSQGSTCLLATLANVHPKMLHADLFSTAPPPPNFLSLNRSGRLLAHAPYMLHNLTTLAIPPYPPSDCILSPRLMIISSQTSAQLVKTHSPSTGFHNDRISAPGNGRQRLCLSSNDTC